MSDERLRQRVRECETYGHVWPRAEPDVEKWRINDQWFGTARWGQCQRCGDSGVFFGPWCAQDWERGGRVSVASFTPVNAYRYCQCCGAADVYTLPPCAGSRLINDGIIPPDAPDWARKALARYAPGGATLDWLST